MYFASTALNEILHRHIEQSVFCKKTVKQAEKNPTLSISLQNGISTKADVAGGRSPARMLHYFTQTLSVIHLLD